VPLKHAARSTAENFEHGVPRKFLEGGRRLSVGTLAYIPNITSVADDVNHDVLMKQSGSFGKPDFVRVALEPVIGKNNLVLLEGDAHATRRRLLSPAFSISNLKRLVPLFARAARVHVGRVAKEAAAAIAASGSASHTREVLGWVSDLTLDVIGNAAFGGFDKAGAAATEELTPAARVAAAITGLAEEHNTDMTLNPLHVLLPRGWWAAVPTAKNGSKSARFAELCRVADAIIEARQASVAGMDAAAPRPRDVLQLMIDARDDGDARRGTRRLSPGQIRDEGLLLIFAGHETTAVLLTWSLFLLTQFPEWMARVRAEADAARDAGACPFDADGDDAEYVDPLKSMPVAYGVLREALRLYPPVALFSRSANRDVSLGKDGRLFLPAGTTVNIAAGLVHRDPAHWPDPEAFSPARWMSDEQVGSLGLRRLTRAEADARASRRAGGKPPAADEEACTALPQHLPGPGDMSFLPFAAGATGCIGSRFAQLEAICVLPHIVASLDVRLAEGYVHAPVSLMTTRPREGLKLDLTPRGGSKA